MNMKIFFSPYTLSLATIQRSQREGVLVKVVFHDGKIGYGDCHPWPELGDDPLPRQIDNLRKGKWSPLTKRTLYYSRIDAEARAECRNLFTDLSLPMSHFLIYDMSQRNFSQRKSQRIKIKVGRDPASELSFLQSLFETTSAHTRFRLDGNSRFDYEGCKKFLISLKPWIDRIDFFEDPIPYEASQWREIQEEFSLPLALDRHSDRYLDPSYPHQVSILKPACQDPDLFCDDFRQLVVTSYVDHPLGQLCAGYTAAQIASTFPQKIGLCGLITHECYEPNPFSERLSVQEGRLIPCTEGYGLGFDDLLAHLRWEAL